MSKELDYIADLERENRLLGERCNQLLKDKGELTDRIDDIKANCDLAIEGRDIKIKELEKENEELKGIKDVATLIKANNDTVVTLMQLNNKLVSKSQQLTKAKEIIKDLLRLPYANDWEVCGDVTSHLDKAEQFIKEIEK